MEHVINCEICSKIFNKSDSIPKILTCGHTFCSNCVTRLRNTSLVCKCGTELDVENTADYPTNYLLLKAIKILKLYESRLCLTVDEMKTKIEGYEKALIEKESILTSNLRDISEDLGRLQGLTDLDDNEILDLDNARHVLIELDNKFKCDRDVLPDVQKLIQSVTINSQEFDNPSKYLTRIYTKLQNGENVYSVKNVNELVKYGKISLQNNLILFHSLSENEIPEKSSTIWFDELKKCIEADNFFSFLKLSCNKKEIDHLVTIKMLSSQLSSRFITLCTGELGLTYKDHYYEKYNFKHHNFCCILKVKHFGIGRGYDYTQCTKNCISLKKGDVTVSVRDSGCFYLSRVKQNGVLITETVGIVKSPKNIGDRISFKDASKLKVVDCGILFKL